MRLEQFEQVLEVAKAGTLSQAARNLFMSQSNLSGSIKQLEEELNCALFVRGPGGVTLTEDGKNLIGQMASIDAKYQLLKSYSKGPLPKALSLRVGIVNQNRTIPYFIELTKKYMGSPVNFAFLSCNSVSEAADKIATCQVDFAVIGIMEPYEKMMRQSLSNRQIEYHCLCRSRVSAVVGPENEFYRREDPLTLADLASQTIITFGNEASDPPSAVFGDVSARVPCFGKITVGSGGLFYEMVKNTPALGLVTSHKGEIYQTKTWPELRFLPIEGYPVRTVTGWIKLKRVCLPEIADELIERINEVY